MNCERCGAILEVNAVECPYCEAPTDLARRLRARQEQEERARAEAHAHAENLRLGALQRQLASRSTHALVWSIVGMVICCLPLGVVGIFQGVRARTLATELGTPWPGKAIAGFTLGILSCIASVVGITTAFIESQKSEAKANARIAQLEASTREGRRASSLDHAVACALAEIHALRNGFDGKHGTYFEEFSCVGRLSQSKDEAQLENFRFKDSSNAFDLNVCFKHGQEWFIQDLRRDACPRP